MPSRRSFLKNAVASPLGLAAGASLIPIETLKAEHRPYDPFVLVPKFANKVRKAIQAALS